MQLEGVYAPVVTPFTAGGGVDAAVYEAAIEHVVRGGVRGVIPCGTTGEYYAMSFDERVQAMTIARDVASGRAQLIAGCNAGGTIEAVRLAEVAAGLGYDGLMLASPPTSLPGSAELAAHVETIADASGLPVVLYDFPMRAGVSYEFDALDRLVEHPLVVGIKESSGNLSRFLALRRRHGDRLQLCCGADDLALDFLFWGTTAWIAGTANVLPRQHVAVVEAAAAGDWATARTAMELLLPWIQDMESGGYNQKAKLGLAHQGIPVGSVRAPLLPLDDETAAAHLSLLDAAPAVPAPV